MKIIQMFKININNLIFILYQNAIFSLLFSLIIIAQALHPENENADLHSTHNPLFKYLLAPPKLRKSIKIRKIYS